MVHPESFCQKCGGPNVVWSAPNKLWNEVVGGPDGIICQVCFSKMAARKGYSIIYRVEYRQKIGD